MTNVFVELLFALLEIRAACLQVISNMCSYFWRFRTLVWIRQLLLKRSSDVFGYHKNALGNQKHVVSNQKRAFAYQKRILGNQKYTFSNYQHYAFKYQKLDFGNESMLLVTKSELFVNRIAFLMTEAQFW